MIPILAVLRISTRRDRFFRIWIPIFLVWLLLLPLVLVLLPLFLIACLALGVNPLRAIAAGWQVLSGLAGTHIEVRDQGHYVLVRII